MIHDEKCLIINPNYLPALNNIASIKNLKNSFFDTLDYLEKYLQIGNDSPDISANIAQAYFATLNFDKGLEYFERTIKDNFSEKNYAKYF